MHVRHELDGIRLLDSEMPGGLTSTGPSALNGATPDVPNGTASSAPNGARLELGGEASLVNQFFTMVKSAIEAFIMLVSSWSRNLATTMSPRQALPSLKSMP